MQHGPWRYSAYNLATFLFTGSGIRVVRAAVDFAAGTILSETRITFRYDALASVSLSDLATHVELRIALTNGFAITLTGASVPELTDAFEEVPGVAELVKILKSIAAEGAHWLERFGPSSDQPSRDRRPSDL